MQSHWLFPAIDSATVAEYAASIGVRPLTARVLLQRGFDNPDAARRFLFPSLRHLHDPYLLTGMQAAIARLRAAIAARENILIYGDYDVDGTISVVILKKAIELAGGQADFHVPHRLRDGYGMRSEVIDRAAATGVRLIISVDTGIRALDVVRGARERGIDVIITDHHLPESELPPAHAVLNPHRRDCAYPDKNLCGAGVAFKLVHALLATLDWPASRMESMLRSFLKLVAIATVADVVPLLGENRIIVKHGLQGLTKLRNPGLRAIMEVSRLLTGDAPSAREVAFQIAPRINAAGRMAHAEDVIHLFLTSDLEQARQFAKQLNALNQERQQTEAEIVNAVLEACAETPVTDAQAGLVFSGAGWHRGVVGIVASRLVERLCRPVFVLSEEEGEARGSGRSIGAFHLLDALESMPDLFTRFGGHRSAAGVGLHAGRVAEFRERFHQYAAARLTPADFRPQLTVDARIKLTELDDDSVLELLELAPFGFGNPPPVLAAEDVELASAPTILKEKHARLHLKQNGRHLMAKAWNFAARCGDLEGGMRMDVAFCLEQDSFAQRQGLPAWCAVLKDCRPSAMGAAR